MATVSANGFGFGLNPSRFTPELFELFRDTQQAAYSPLLFNNEITRVFMNQKLAELAANHANRREGANASDTTFPPTQLTAAGKRKLTVSSPNRGEQSSDSHDIEEKPKKRSRIGGQSVKTAEVWRFFVQIPNEQAATCMICSKTIKATNSSTTGMIRHLRSCHTAEHEVLQNARRQNLLRKSGVTEADLNELASHQTQQSDKDSTTTTGDVDRISDTIDSVAASTSSLLSDDHHKTLHSIERLISTPRCASSPKSASAADDDVEHKPVVKRGRPPKITSDEPINRSVTSRINAEIAILIVFGVLNVDIVDNTLFRNFIGHLSPDATLATAEEFRTQIIPALNNSSLNAQALATNNASFPKTSTPKTPRSKQTRTSAEGSSGASPAPTNESGFHDDEEHHSSTDTSSLMDILSLCDVNKCKSDKSDVTVSSDYLNNVMEEDFNELLDYIGHDIFPMTPLYHLMTRCHKAYKATKDSEFVCTKIFQLLDTDCKTNNIDVYLENKNSDDSGIELDSLPKQPLPQLWKALCFGVNCYKEINVLIQDTVLTDIPQFDSEDVELLTAVHHHITNPNN